MKLLYAEDEISMSEAVVDILQYHNYIVDAVYDGSSALEYARAEHYDGVILDIMMPNKSGIEVLQALRREGYNPLAYRKKRDCRPYYRTGCGSRRLSSETI